MSTDNSLRADPKGRVFLPGSAGVPPASLSGAGSWHCRGYLPHFDAPGLYQVVTFRLADALPTSVRAQLVSDKHDRKDAGRRQLEAIFDAGHGMCDLRDEAVARMVQTALQQFDGVRYHLMAWVLMPNHVHVLIETIPGQALSDIIHSWKSFTSKAANQLLKRTGVFWQPDYFDRAIRDESHFWSAVSYIHENPVKAGLVSFAAEWPYSSAAGAGGTPALPGGGTSDGLHGELR